MLNSWTHITLFTLVLLRPLGGVIFIYSWFLLLCFTLYPFVTKRGSNFLFLDRKCISKQVK
jgi:hypothetical protein